MPTRSLTRVASFLSLLQHPPRLPLTCYYRSWAHISKVGGSESSSLPRPPVLSSDPSARHFPDSVIGTSSKKVLDFCNSGSARDVVVPELFVWRSGCKSRSYSLREDSFRSRPRGVQCPGFYGQAIEFSAQIRSYIEVSGHRPLAGVEGVRGHGDSRFCLFAIPQRIIASLHFLMNQVIQARTRML